MAKPRKLAPGLHLVLVSYATIALGSFLAIFVAYRYAKSVDPWLTPRLSVSMGFYSRVSGIFGPIAFYGSIAGIVLALSIPELRHSRLMWLTVGLFVLAFYLAFP
jgi:hypothetical protein